jgi:ribonuclease VapC
MILDTSALLAILFEEPESDLYIQIIHDADQCRISAANFMELCMVVEQQLGGTKAVVSVKPFFAEPKLSLNQLLLSMHTSPGRPSSISAREGHPAGLNFGDCFAYALARITGEPLLFKGRDFKKTDIRAAG